MTFMHKLSRRLARLKTVAVLAGLTTAACTGGPVAGAPGEDPTFEPSSSLAANRTNHGDRITTLQRTNVRQLPAGGSLLLGRQAVGSQGTIVGGPVYDESQDSLPRWQIDYDTGADGWANGNHLKRIAKGVVASVTLSPAAASVAAGDSVSLVPMLRDSLGHVITGQATVFASGNAAVATVSGAGVVRGLSPGSATISGVTNGRTGTATVTVTAPPVASVQITPDPVSVVAGGTVPVAVLAKDAGGATVTGATIALKSLDTLKARISAAGVVTGIAVGTTFIVATSDNRSDTAAVAVTAPAAPAIRVGFYASPTGTAGGSGSYTSPWTLAYALAGGGGRVMPGDTIWLRGGTYRGNFVSTVSGLAGRPVVVRQLPGERAIIDGAGTSTSISVFRVSGQYSVFWGFEVTNSDPVRTTASTANNVRPNVVSNYANHTRYISLVVHDGGVAFYNEKDYFDVEITGCIFYNNGWQGPDRGHGHAIYIKTNAGPVVARDNIIFNQFGYGIHVYSNAGSGQMNNIRLEGNVAFNNGALSTNSTASNILYGGDDYATGASLIDNMTYFSPGLSGTNVKVGYGTKVNGTMTVQGNYAVGGSSVFDMGYWTTALVASNSFIGNSTMISLNDPTTAGKVFTANSYLRDPSATAWRYRGSSYSFSGWRSATGLAAADLAATGTPSLTRVIVRPSAAEAGRANVIVYNWGRLSSVSVALGTVLQPGDRYEIRNVQNLFGAPAASGTYNGGNVSIPITGVTPPAPVGWTTTTAPRTGPDFDVFVVVKLN